MYEARLNAMDLGPVLVDQMGLVFTAQSPFARLREQYKAGAFAVTEDHRRRALEPALRSAASALARPTICARYRVGGGTIPVAPFVACRGADDDAVTVLSQEPGGAYLVQRHDSTAAYAEWWSDTFAVKSGGSGGSLPPMAVESFLYLLHTLDAYRRATYRGLLDYATTDTPRIAASEFTASMGRAIEARDARWLLPSFLAVTPGIDAAAIAPKSEHVEALTKLGLLIGGRDPSTKEPLLVFGDEGRRLAAEFYRSWAFSIGVEITRGGKAQRAFIAPTGSSNHVFEIDGTKVRHIALGREGVAEKTKSWFGSDARQETTEYRVCPKCRAWIRAGSKFCNECGSAFATAPAPGTPPAPPKAEPKPPVKKAATAAGNKACAKCRAQNWPHAKFCSNCAAPFSGPIPPAPESRPAPGYTPCLKCGTQNWGQSKFCVTCAAPVGAAPAGAACPHCRAENPPTNAFCMKCGKPMTAAAPQASKCKKCGAALVAGAAFCVSCGTRQ